MQHILLCGVKMKIKKVANLNKAIMEMKPEEARSNSRIFIEVGFNSGPNCGLCIWAGRGVKPSFELAFYNHNGHKNG